MPPLKPSAHGAPPQMPSVTLELGKYVTARPRADGTHRVLFEVPARLRPSDWSPTLPLPLLQPRTGDLADAGEVARIQRDAERLLAELRAARCGRKHPAPVARTMQMLVTAWQASQRYKGLKPRTQDGYAYFADRVLRWAERAGNPDPTPMTRDDVERFLSAYDDRPTMRYQMRNALLLIMDQAVSLRWRPDNPVAEVRVSLPQTGVTIWEPEDLDRHVWGAAVAGLSNLAAMIQVEWEIGQRPTDLILLRQARRSNQGGYDYDARVFRFWQSKTKSYVTIPVSERTAEVLAKVRVEDSPYVFHDDATGRPYRDVDRLGHVFGDLRDAIVMRDAGGEAIYPHHVFRALRHSCVVQLARAGCTVPEIASITGHKLSTVQSIIDRYCPRDNQVAWAAQAKRGLVAARISG